jgi:peptidoglycan/xylan/chitin deacetylase (PgdA/CDA1 family)
VLGMAAIRRPELIRRMVDEGHVVASHTWGHANLTDIMVSPQH